MKMVIILAVLALVAGQPRWQNRRVWIYTLQKGLTQKEVLRLLSKPTYEIIGSPQIKWYYQDTPRAVPFSEAEAKENKIPCHSKTLVRPKTGHISFKKEVVERYPRKVVFGWVVDEWVEPKWETVSPKPPAEKPKPKRKLPQKLEGWKTVGRWRRLKKGLGVVAVERQLGMPMYEIRGEGKTGGAGITWYYGNARGCGYLLFRDQKLTCWTEPFWPEVERNIYGKKASTDPDHPGEVYDVLKPPEGVSALRGTTFRDRVYEIEVEFTDTTETNLSAIRKRLELKYGKNTTGRLTGSLFGEATFTPTMDDESGLATTYELTGDQGRVLYAN